MNSNSTSRESIDSCYFDREYYSILLLAFMTSRQRWLAEEYESGRIAEKQFLEALVIETSDRLLSTDEDEAAT